MNEVASHLLLALGRTSLLLSVTALVLGGLLRLARPASPAVHRAVWLLVLLEGWLWLRLPVPVPYYDSTPRSTPAPQALPWATDTALSGPLASEGRASATGLAEEGRASASAVASREAGETTDSGAPLALGRNLVRGDSRSGRFLGRQLFPLCSAAPGGSL